MYSVRRDPRHSCDYSQYWTMNCQQQHRQMIKTKQQYFYSTRVYNNNNKESYIQHYSLNNNSIKSTDSTHSPDISLPVYRAPCTFQNSLISTTKDEYTCGVIHRSPLSSSSCVPDVYSPGPTSSGNCSLPPPSSNLPPPPSEWLD